MGGQYYEYPQMYICTSIMNPKEMGISTRNWIDSAQDRDYWGALVNAALNLQVS